MRQVPRRPLITPRSAVRIAGMLRVAPAEDLADVVEAHRDALAGAVVVDITNPLDFSTFTPLQLDAGSAAQEVAAAAPDAKVVKAFNTSFAGTLDVGTVSGQPLDVFIAGDDDGALSYL